MSAGPRQLVAFDGREGQADHRERCDVAVVGSGPAGAAVARALARAGVDVTVVEEGAAFSPTAFAEPSFSAMAQLYRDLGASVTRGRPAMPFVQGRAVGGTSLVNGAISWRLPRDVYDTWVTDDPGLGEALPWEEIDQVGDGVIGDLHIAPTPDDIAGPHNLLMAAGAEALGLEHRPIRRNVRDCRGLGRCMQGCPIGRKMSMDRSYLPDAVAAGARILSSTRVERIVHRYGRALGIVGRAAGGGRVDIRAEGAVVLAASAVQTPLLLRQSGIRQGPVGDHFQCHPGVSVAARFADPIRMWTGATQGHEVIGLRREGLKFEALGYDMTLTAARLPGIGRDLLRGIRDLAHWANWGVAVKAASQGRVRAGRRRARVRLALSRADMARMRRGVEVLCRLLLAAGAQQVAPGVHGWHRAISEPAQLDDFAEAAPWDPRAYSAAVTHMFGTCRMGSDPDCSVVGTDFRHHAVDRLYVADSSVFPTNTGVNPQTSILALATLCGRRVMRALE